MYDLIIKNAFVISLDGKNLKNVDILIDKGKILKIGKLDNNKEYKAKEIINAENSLVMPSFCNTHTHISMSLLRGLGKDLPLKTWLEKVIWPLESNFVSKEFVKDGALISIAEMIRGGTTAFLDMYFFEEEIVPILEEANIVGFLGFGILDFPTKVAKTPKEYIQRARSFIESLKDNAFAKGVICPHAPYTCSKDTLFMVKELAEETKALVHMHVSETEQEVISLKEKTKKDPFFYLDEIGLLNERFIAAHCVYVNEEEIALCRERKVSFVHCPQSNLKLGSGIAPVYVYMKEGINVALGTDGPASNDNLSMIEELRTAVFLQKGYFKDPSVMDSKMSLSIATKNGFKALSLNAGSIEEGKDANLIIFSLESVRAMPVYDEEAFVLYSAFDDDIKTVISMGKVIYDKGEFKTIDIEKVKFLAKSWSSKIGLKLLELQ